MNPNELLKQIADQRAKSPPPVAWNTYAAAELASQVDGIHMTVPFVLGLVAGFSLIETGQSPQSPFAPTSSQDKVFASGLRYAFAADSWNRNQKPSPGDIVNLMFGGAR